MRLIRDTDTEARNAITYERDALVGGFRENWQTEAETEVRGLGECEDFAIYAAMRLMDRGVPAEALYLTLVNTLAGPHFNHCVLLVETPSGLVTCADTRGDEPQALDDAYDEDMMRQWARLDKPREWRKWG